MFQGLLSNAVIFLEFFKALLFTIFKDLQMQSKFLLASQPVLPANCESQVLKSTSANPYPYPNPNPKS